MTFFDAGIVSSVASSRKLDRTHRRLKVEALPEQIH